MQKCTLSRIKSYEERHHKPQKPINNKINYIKDINNDNLNIANNKTDSTNIKILHKIYDKKDNLSNSKRRINSVSTNFIKRNEKTNIYNSNIAQKIKNTFFKNKTSINNQKMIKPQKNIINPKQNIRIINNNFYNKNYLLSTDNTSGDIDITNNEDINEFNSDEKESLLKGHIPSITNILCFPKYFGKAKQVKEQKEAKNNKNEKINESNEYTLIKIEEKGLKIYSENNNKDKIFKKFNFDQPNKKIIYKINTNISNNKNLKKNRNETKQISSYNNLSKVKNILKKLTYKNDHNINKNNSSYCFTIKKISKEKITIKKDLSSNYINKRIKFTTSKNVEIDKIVEVFQRKKSQNKNDKNFPTIFIKNSILNSINIKNPLTKYNNKKRNANNSNEKTLSDSKKPEPKKINMKQNFKPKMKKIININLNEKEENNTSNKSIYNNYKKNFVDSSQDKLQNISNNLSYNYDNNTIKKHSTQMYNKNSNHNINYTKRIIKRVNKTKMIDKTDENEVINLIYSKNNSNPNNNKIKNNNSLKGIKQITESTIINYSNTYTNSNSESNLFFKNDINNSESDTDKEDNSTKKKYISCINKNFDNAKKILNKSMKSKENEKRLLIPKKINSCSNNKNSLGKKILNNKLNMKMISIIFKKYHIEKECLIKLSLVNKSLHKKIKIIIFQFYYNKIIKDKECEKNKINILKNTFSYSTQKLYLKNKNEIIRLYKYYSKEIKSNYKYEILQDISRTFPNDINFNKNIKNKLYDLLTCYSNFNKSIGYAQGLNFVAASCLYFFQNEEDAFLFLDSFINKFELYNLLGIDNKILIQKINYFEILINKYIPDLNEYLNSKLLNHEFFSAGWTISVFSNNMDKNKLLTCWCFMIVFGWKFFYSFIIQVLIKYKDSIINSEEKQLSDKMRNILNNKIFLEDFNKIIKNTLKFMLDHIIL